MRSAGPRGGICWMHALRYQRGAGLACVTLEYVLYVRVCVHAAIDGRYAS